MDIVHTDLAQPIVAPLDQEGTRAVVRAWLKPAGAQVRKDEPVVELETDKVLVEVCAPCEGTLEVVVAEQAEALPGSVLGRVMTASSLTESRIGSQAGSQAGSQVDSGAVPGERTASGPASTEPREHGGSSTGGEPVRLSPSVRKLVAENDIDPSTLAGTGRGGRLTRADVVRAIEQDTPHAAPATPSPETTDPNAPTEREREAVREAIRHAAIQAPHASVRIPHSNMRRRIAEHMQHSVTTAPHVTAVFEADFSAILAHKKRHKDAFAAQGVHLTLTAYFVAACVEAMRAVPEVNSRWHDDALEVFGDINIGVGASLGDKGLVVPVIHQTQDLSLMGIASRLQRMTEAARAGKLKPADVQGGTFTISNHGVSGSLFAAPIIINQPQCAILGVGAVEKRVVVREVNGNDTLQILPCAYVSLTIDHRALDGSQTNAWLQRFVDAIEQWPRETTS